MLRATLKSLLSRKLRLILSGFAVVLGVMFVSGALVLTDTLGRSFDNLFTDIYTYTDIQVAKPSDVPDMQSGQATPQNMPASDVARVAAVPGVASAKGQIFVDGARVIGKNGKVLPAGGGPRFGAGWSGEDNLVQLREGAPPSKDTEVVLSALAAKKGHFSIGETVSVLPLRGTKQAFTISGISEYKGGRDSLAGETTVFFTEPVAQKLMLGETGVFNVIDVKASPGVPLPELRDRISAALGSGYDVKTGEQLAADTSEGVKQFLNFFNYVLLGFAGVALFVGVFLILNTFSIIVAQRTQELALFRAVGASRRQMVGSVLIEALVIGFLASVIGLLLGIGIGAGLGTLLGNFLGGGDLRLAGLAVPASAVIAAFGVGVGITLLAALMPAIRASRVPPVAAMREAATPDRPLTRLTIIGATVVAVGAALLTLGLTGSLGKANLSGVLGGILLAFTGVALLTPIVSRPVVGVIGWIFSRRAAAGRLGQRNSERNPRRTAITAAALMVSIALVTGISVVLSSIRESTRDAINNDVNAELIVAAEATSGQPGFMDPSAITEIRKLPGVESAVALYADLGLVNGSAQFVGAADDLPAALSMFEMKADSGVLTPSPNGVLVDTTTAKSMDLNVGSKVSVRLARSTAPRDYTVTGIYERTAAVSGMVLPFDAAADFRNSQPMQAFIRVSPGTDVAAVQSQVDNILRDSPEVTVQTISDWIGSFDQIFNFILIFVQILLALAMIIAVLGIINTLALSMIERTRELGLLRAVGMKRGQVTWMISVESVVISVFGALLGLLVGMGLGAAVFAALRDQGFTKLAFPWTLMVIYLFASVLVGFAAAIVPAFRAARLDVLKAIAYE